MKISLLTATLCSLVLSNSAVALTCPTPDAINKAGFDLVQHTSTSPKGWDVIQKHNTYGTPETWSFTVLDVDSTDSQDALMLMKSYLPSMEHAYFSTSGENNSWDCYYWLESGNGVTFDAVAHSPAKW